MARGSRSPNASDSRPGRRERDRDYDRDRDRRSSRYDEDRPRHDDRRRERRDDGDERNRSSRRGSERDSYRRDSGRDRNSERDRDAGREPQWGARAGGSSRRSASPRRPSRAGSRSKSRSKSPEEDKAKPNFGASGLLAAETKTVKDASGNKTVLKYHEPPEARKPVVGWRLYVFKDNQEDVLHIARQSAYLFGRDRTVVDVVLEHPSCSKQHAVIQFRQVKEKNEFGEVKATVKPFIIDLESTNGTHVNDIALPTSRYVELKLQDIIKFGESAREYVLLSEDAA
ncbi:hypothetical protein EIP91_002873 [Steccherinum ochraceum]|uniref:FHA domain-containing protein n=1 Tax=Steccherinum ochraceum TaxID=92696 RepID=A0A4V2MXL0_9APHY|nr:hypothetical protein EIP91_002873 [Steccherinum ochraceum]